MAHRIEISTMIKRYHLPFDQNKFVDFILDMRNEVLEYIHNLKSISDDELKQEWKEYKSETDQKITYLESRITELESKISSLENSIY